MTLQEIKDQYSVSTLNLNTATNEDGSVYKDARDEEWMRHWEDSTRLAVSIPKKLVHKLKQDSTLQVIAQEETKEGSKGEYTAVRIIEVQAEVTL